MTDRRARLAATRSPAFMAGYDAYAPGAMPPTWDRRSVVIAEQVQRWRDEYASGWWSASDDYEFDREDRQPIHRRPSPMSAFERNRP